MRPCFGENSRASLCSCIFDIQILLLETPFESTETGSISRKVRPWTFVTFASRPTISMGPEPIDHTVHDFLVVPLQHQRVAVASDAGFRQHIDGHVAAELLNLLLKRARGRDTIRR